MRNISLLPDYIKKDIVLSKRLTLAAVILLIVAVIAMFAYGAMGLLMPVPITELEAMDSDNLEVSSQIAELKSLLNQYNQINQNINDFKKLTEGILPANKVIYELCSNAPGGILILRINTYLTGSESDRKAIIEGTSTKQESLAIWMSRMKESEYVREVYCKMLQETTDGSGAKSYRFTLEVPLKEGE